MGLRDSDRELIDLVLRETDIGSLMRDASEISKWVRTTGSPEEAAAFDYIEARCSETGARISRYRPIIYSSMPVRAKFEVAGVEIPCITHSMAASTPPSGLRVRLREWSAMSSAGPDPAGSQSRRDPNPASQDLPLAAVIDGAAAPALLVTARQRGAAACVFIAETDTPPEMIVSPVWGSPGLSEFGNLPDIPAISLGAPGGRELRRLMASGHVTGVLTTEVRTGWVETQCLVGDVGREDGPFVLLSGHVDSWYHGAMDNATGNAAQIEAARIFAKHACKLRRGIRIAFWSGHSHGRYAGSTWYADRFHEELAKRACVHVNSDCLGGKGATVLTEANVMAETKRVGDALVKAIAGQVLSGARFTRMGDQSFWGCGVPSLFVTPSEQPPGTPGRGNAGLLGKSARSGGLGPWWHRAEDTMDGIDPDMLLRDARIVLGAVAWFTSSPVLALDAEAGARDLVRGLEDWRGKLRSTVESGAGAAAGAGHRRAVESLGIDVVLDECIRRAREAAEVLAEAGRRMDGTTPSLPEDALRKLDKLVMDVERSLVRLNYTERPDYYHDPALPMPAVPLLSPVDAFVRSVAGSASARAREDQAYAALVELRRRLNRILEETEALSAKARALAEAVQRAISVEYWG